MGEIVKQYPADAVARDPDLNPAAVAAGAPKVPLYTCIDCGAVYGPLRKEILKGETVYVIQARDGVFEEVVPGMLEVAQCKAKGHGTMERGYGIRPVAA